jgi:lincosamide and streptogramin A transport system ATP-binding/permease protein
VIPPFCRGKLRDYARDCGIDESLFKAILRKLDFSAFSLKKDIRDFSGGQKKKGAHRPQPVRASAPVCMGRAAQLHRRALAHADRGADPHLQAHHAVVEHDRAFVDAVATHVVEM